MREKLGPWGDGVDDATLAYALLGLGMVPSTQYGKPDVALRSLLATLNEDAGLAFLWRFDPPRTPQAWAALPAPGSIAAVVKGFAAPRPLRFELYKDSQLSALDAGTFVGTSLSPTDVATYISCDPSQRRVRLRWPLRIGFLPGANGEGIAAHLRSRDSWGGNVYEAAVLTRRNAECDVLVCVEAGGDAAAQIESATRLVGTVRADVVTLFSDSPAAGDSLLPRLEQIRALVDAGGIAHLGLALGDPLEFVRGMCIELSHNHTLDVALARATGGRALLLASTDLLDASKLEFKVTELATALTAGSEARIEIDRPRMGRWAESAHEESRMGNPKRALPPPQPRVVSRGIRGPMPSAPISRPPSDGSSRGSGSGSGFGIGRASQPARRGAVTRPTQRAKPPDRAATRVDLGRYLRRSVKDFEWHSESAEASEVGKVMKALADEDVKQATARYLQAGFATEKKPDVILKGTLKAATNYFVNVFIGTPRTGFARGGAAFPDLAPREDGRAHELDVVFWEPKLCPTPQVLKMDLPPLGATLPVKFPLTTRKNTTAINARISIVHRNRVLQTGMLTAPVGRKGEVAFELDAIPRRILSGLDQRTNFSMAMVLNDVEGDGEVHLMRDGKAKTFKLDNSDVNALVAALNTAISDITADPSRYQGLEAPGSRELLLNLAALGSGMRDQLVHVVAGELITPDYVQVVSTKPGKSFPLEYVYDFAPPDEDAKLCPNAVASLAAGDCLSTCERHKNPAVMEKTVCPFGFWGVRCVIERRLQDKLKTATAEPSDPKDAVLHPLTSVLVGATSKADAVEPKSVANMLTRIRKLDPTCSQVDAWAKWPDEVARAQPSTIALVVHQEVDAQSLPLIEIGQPPLLSSKFFRPKHVRAPGSTKRPIVLLIGCQTAITDISFENFSTLFQWNGAAQVVSTIAEIVGRQAAPLAAEILETIQRVKEPTSFSVIMRDVRRNLLAAGTPMVLSLRCEGDADWEVVGGKE